MFNSINLFKMIFMYKYCHINYKKEYQAKCAPDLNFRIPVTDVSPDVLEFAQMCGTH